MQQTQQPGTPEHPLFPFATARHGLRQQPVGRQHGDRCQQHAGNRGDCHGVNQPTALQPESGVLLLAYLDEEHKTAGDAHTAEQTARHVQPAQRPVFEVLQVQAGEKLIDGTNRVTRRVVAQ